MPQAQRFKRGPTPRRLLLPALAAITAGACGPSAVLSQADTSSVDQASELSQISSSQEIDESRRTAIVRAAARVAPAVVSVNVMRTRRVRPRTMWESMILPPGAQQRSTGFGSGVIVSEDGIVITNDHVITGASEIKITLPGGRDFNAEIVGTDPVADIAVLRITGDDLPAPPVGTAKGL